MTAIITISATLTTQHVPANRLAVSLPVWRRLCRESAVQGIRGASADQLHILTSDEEAEALDALDDELRARAQTVGEFVGATCVVLLTSEGIDGCDAWAVAHVDEIAD